MNEHVLDGAKYSWINIGTAYDTKPVSFSSTCGSIAFII